MPHSDWPTVGEITTFITNSGVSLPGTPDYANILSAVIAEIERVTRFHPFKADTSFVKRYFDPPGPNRRSTYIAGIVGGGDVLSFNAGLVTLNTIKVGVAYDKTGGYALTDGIDYYLHRYNADKEDSPYMYLEFKRNVWGERRSIEIDAKWGWQATIPDDMWYAARKLCASYAVNEFKPGLASRPIEWAEADVRERQSIELMNNIGKEWSDYAYSVFQNYSRGLIY